MTDEPCAMPMGGDALREHLRQLLHAGLVTAVEPRCYASEEVRQVVGQLQAIAANDYAEKLVISGFTLDPYCPPDSGDDLSQACDTCMYFVLHRRWCCLPELDVPVEGNWSCRLWRI